jgi:predicted amidophosphoribosyltransferase
VDFLTGEKFSSLAKDLVIVAPDEIEDLKLKQEKIRIEREKQIELEFQERIKSQESIRQEKIKKLEEIRIQHQKKIEHEFQERINKHAIFLGLPNREGFLHESLVSMPAHGYLVCSSCQFDLDNTLKIQCAACKWPICPCGACRCGASIHLHPERIYGPWRSGITLDVQTLESHHVSDDEFGQPRFETRRSELGQLLYQFKYQHNQSALKDILALAINYFIEKKLSFDLVVPVPSSSNSRNFTWQIASGLATGLSSTSSNTAIVKIKATDELKSVTDHDERVEILSGAFSADSGQLNSKKILLVDDLFRSGATLEAVTQAAYYQGKAREVWVFAVTRTRVHR